MAKRAKRANVTEDIKFPMNSSDFISHMSEVDQERKDEICQRVAKIMGLYLEAKLRRFPSFNITALSHRLITRDALENVLGEAFPVNYDTLIVICNEEIKRLCPHTDTDKLEVRRIGDNLEIINVYG